MITASAASSSSSSTRTTASRSNDELSLTTTCDDRAPRANLPMDKDFLPLDSPMQDEVDLKQEQEHMRNQVICMITVLPGLIPTSSGPSGLN
ncbi:hypothetical protein PR003_g23498 [Phytophthora rubi]|uniref:Uncharacterized protein n=1 Tax=Phytophthora rubi TaxID=129364 RepID=A0A6A4CYN0_9STRA|nr:hypothetical protein PR003_g23498 [Phytophthora rubi]